jgi:hypothetical protein
LERISGFEKLFPQLGDATGRNEEALRDLLRAIAQCQGLGKAASPCETPLGAVRFIFNDEMRILVVDADV